MEHQNPETKHSPGRAINFADVFEFMSQPLAIGEPNKPNNLIYVNKAYCDLTGYAKGELIGRNPGFLQGTTYSKRREVLREALDAGHPIDVLVENYRKDGTMFWNELHIHPVTINGKCAFFVGMARDVTARVTDAINLLKENIDIVREFREKLKD